MSDSGRLWFHIERVFREIEEQCVRGRAAELLFKKRDAEPNWLDADGSNKPENYMMERVEERFPQARDLAADPAFQEKFGGRADLVSLRSEVRKRLVWLKSRLSEVLTEREVYYCLFPLVVYADELVYAVAHDRAATYQPLQGELYEIDNGGELFYTIIEDLLRKDETIPIIFEVFYFCLNDGFLGLHESDPAKREEYKNRLAFRIPVNEVEVVDVRDAGDRAVKLVAFPKWYYVGAAGLALGAFFLFHVFAYAQVAE